MASNLPTIQRLRFEDYARSTGWQDALQALVESLNLFMPQIYNILNGGISYQNLIAPQIYTKVITAAATTTFSFVNPLAIPPQSVLVGNVWAGIPSTHPAAAVQIFWHLTGNTITVDNVTGLIAGTKYTLVLVIL